MNVQERFISIVASGLGLDENKVRLSDDFIDDLGADSLDVVELIMAVEEEFAIEVPDDEAEGIKNVGEAIEYIEGKI